MNARVGLAGRVEVSTDHALVGEDRLPGLQSQLAFAVLVLERHRPPTSSEMAEILWPEGPPESWSAGLRNVMSRVRGFLAEAGLDAASALHHEGGGYRLSLPDGATVDIEEAEADVTAAAAALAGGDGATALQHATNARSVLDRPVLATVDSPWLDRLRDRLGELRARATELEAEALLATGEHHAALALAEEVVELDPLRESAHRLLMRAHDGCGNRGLALRAYERCRLVLADELGIDPSPETEAVYVGLLGSEPLADPAGAPAPPAGGTTATTNRSGTLSFLMSDIEASPAHWARDPERMAAALEQYAAFLSRAVDEHGGRIFRHADDGVVAVFAAAHDALASAVDAQRLIHRASWPTTEPVRVRIGVHTGDAQARADEFAGAVLTRVASVCELAAGGQVLTTSATRHVIDGRSPADVELQHVGDVVLPGMTEPESVYVVSHPDLPPVAARLGTPARPVGSPVVGGRGFVGRTGDLATVAEAMQEAQLVSITGLGGVGKTRLAMEAATTAEVARATRTWWADLAASDAAGVAHAVADVVGAAKPGSGPVDATVEELSGGPALLVLDNCEHVLDATEALVRQLLAGCSALRILATSRVPLGLPGERVVSLRPLPSPAPDASAEDIRASPAVEVFVRRAREASATFRIDEANAGAVAEICRRLDGLPLAIELAAARVRTLAPEQIASHLDRRFRLLRGAERGGGDTRHRNLEEILTWSRQLLDDREQRVFDRLSMMADAFALESAVAVTADDDMDDLDVLDVLDGLVERALVLTVDDRVQTRYRLLETVREFGRRHLAERGEVAEIAHRHRLHHLSLVEEAAVGMQGADEEVWVRQVSLAFGDLRAAFRGAADDGDVDTCLRMVVGLHDYAFFRMRGEVGDWAVEAVCLPGAADHHAFADAAGSAAFLAWQRGDEAVAQALIERSDGAGGGWLADEAAGTVAIFRGEVDGALARWLSAGDVARRESNPYREAIAMSQVAFAHVFLGDTTTAERLARQSDEIARRTQNPSVRAQAQWALGVSLYARDPRAALDELDEAIALSRSVGNRMSVGSAAVPAEELRAKLAEESRGDELAASIDRLDYWLSAGNAPTLWTTMRRIAWLLVAAGEHEAAALAFGAEAAAALKLPMREREQVRHDAAVEEVRLALGDERFARTTERGGRLALDQLGAALRAAAERAASTS